MKNPLELSLREKEIYDLKQQGLSYKKISALLGITSTTISFALNSVNKKLKGINPKKLHISAVNTNGKRGGGIVSEQDQLLGQTKTQLFSDITKLNSDQVLLGYLALPEKARELFCKGCDLSESYNKYKYCQVSDANISMVKG